MPDPKPKRKVSKEVLSYLRHKRAEDMANKYKPPPGIKVVDAVEDPHQLAPTPPATEDDEAEKKRKAEELRALMGL
jgi:hypothetical protein